MSLGIQIRNEINIVDLIFILKVIEMPRLTKEKIEFVSNTLEQTMFVSEVIRWWQVRWHGIEQPWNPRQLREAIVSVCESSEF